MNYKKQFLKIFEGLFKKSGLKNLEENKNISIVESKHLILSEAKDIEGIFCEKERSIKYSEIELYDKSELNGLFVEREGDNYTNYWFKDGVLHRDGDLPAVESHTKWISNFPHKKWYKNGKLHREGGPAVIYKNGEEEWYINGQLHREDGPAQNFHQHNQFRWFKNGVLHRENGPAFHDEEHTFEEYYLNGVKHRDSAPAAFYDNQHRCEYWSNGVIHNERGPAVLKKDSKNNITYEWWINGNELTESQFNNYKLKDILEENLVSPKDDIKVKRIKV